MDAELTFHMEAYTNDLIRSGVPREEAMRRARLEFGGVERAKEECRDATGVTFVESLVQDIRYGLRVLRKAENPDTYHVTWLKLLPVYQDWVHGDIQQAHAKLIQSGELCLGCGLAISI